MQIERNIAKNLIPLQKYAKLKHKKPYLFNFFKGKQEIFYLGVEHSKNPKNKQFSEIENWFNKFLNTHKKKDIVIILENYTPSLVLPKNEMIEKFGETGLVYFLAQKHNLKTICPEPSQKQILKFVKSRKNKTRNILLWIFLNIISNKFKLKEIKKLQDPFIKFSELNKIGADFNLARDYYISKEILKQLKSGYSVFAVFGVNHVICQEPVLRKWFWTN
jgi:hypothetical protein